MTERVERTVGPLLDDEVRRQREIPNDRVEQSIEESALSKEESLALHEQLGEEGVAITFDKEEDEAFADDSFPESEKAEADRTVSRDLLRACLADIAARPLLTCEEEVQLARKIGEARRVEQAISGGESVKTPEIVRTIEEGLVAKRRLVLAHMRLVLSIARRYRHRSNLDLLDLMQEGAAALMRAAEKFDPDRGSAVLDLRGVVGARGDHAGDRRWRQLCPDSDRSRQSDPTAQRGRAGSS